MMHEFKRKPRFEVGERVFNSYQIGRESEDEELMEIIDRFLMESDKQK